MLKLMTPGPTQISEAVRQSLGNSLVHPDLDEKFSGDYIDLCARISSYFGTSGQCVVFPCSSSLAIEALCRSLFCENDSILSISNGYFGDLMYSCVKDSLAGNIIYHKTNTEKSVDLDELETWLVGNKKKIHYAIFVHCETTTGVINDIEGISKLLRKFSITPIVDIVSSAFAYDIRFDDWKIGACVIGGQKALSAVPGISCILVNNDLSNSVRNKRQRKSHTKLLDIGTWLNYNDTKYFPFTYPVYCFYAFMKAFESIECCADETVKKHFVIASAFRNSIQNSGLKLFGHGAYSNTVSAVTIPPSIKPSELIYYVKEKFKIQLSLSLGDMFGKVIRIGHMGYNANRQDLYFTLTGLQQAFEAQNYTLNYNIADEFDRYLLILKANHQLCW